MFNVSPTPAVVSISAFSSRIAWLSATSWPSVLDVLDRRNANRLVLSTPGRTDAAVLAAAAFLAAAETAPGAVEIFGDDGLPADHHHTPSPATKASRHNKTKTDLRIKCF